MIENNYFFKKLTSKHTEQKERCVCCKKRRIPIYITKTILRKSKPERQVTYSINMKKVDLDES